MTTDLLPPGTELFGYVIGRKIGKGGMGTVYLAKQKSLDRQVALKVLHPHRLQHANAVENFLREARNAAKLNHENLVAIHAIHADTDRGVYCYSMEYVPGASATKLVVDNGPLKRPLAMHLTYQVAQALAHAHRHDLVHRDVKPDNILVTESGVAKLLDLGLVRDRMEDLTEPGARLLTIVGTPEYSAPEQSRNPTHAGPASDVYSLGATLYFLLTGKVPFLGHTVIDTIVRAATEPVRYPDNVPADCRALLDLMLAKRPTARLRDGDAVVTALKDMAEGKSPSLHADLGADDSTIFDAEPEDDDGEDDDRKDDAGGASRRRRVRRRRYH
jgi:eukaryotic-like serine/threonine-protein kinase